MLNGQRTSLIAHFRERDGKLSATAKDLSELGIATDKLGAADTATLELDQIAGLRYRYDAAAQSIDMEVPDAIRKPYTFDTRELTATPNATSSRGFLINYDAFAQTQSNAQLALWSEQRYFDPAGVLSNTGIAYLYSDLHRYVRYDTSWSMSNPATLSTTQFGDTISSSLDWTRSFRIAGFQWRSNFALRPDLVTFPLQALSGTAVVPSAVDLYINNVRQFTGNVPSGPFIVNNVPGITGAGEATVITHDALGRTISTTLPLYVDTRMLAAGLSSYSFEAGFLRRNYGVESFSYDPSPAVSATARRGVTDSLTLEGHAEATGGLVNAGAGALVRMGMAGVISGSASASAGKLNGAQLGIGYQLIEPRFSIDAQTLRAYGNYGDLGARDGTPVPTATDRVTLALPFFSRQTLSLSYIGYRFPGAPSSRIGSLSYTLNFGNLASLTLSTYKDFLQHDSQGIFLTASFGLGNNTAINASVGRQNGQSTYNVNAQRPPDYAGGWGWGRAGGRHGRGALPSGPGAVPRQIRRGDGHRPGPGWAGERVARHERRGRIHGSHRPARTTDRRWLCTGVHRRRRERAGAARKPRDRYDRYRRPPADPRSERVPAQPGGDRQHESSRRHTHRDGRDGSGAAIACGSARRLSRVAIQRGLGDSA